VLKPLENAFGEGNASLAGTLVDCTRAGIASSPLKPADIKLCFTYMQTQGFLPLPWVFGIPCNLDRDILCCSSSMWGRSSSGLFDLSESDHQNIYPQIFSHKDPCRESRNQQILWVTPHGNSIFFLKQDWNNLGLQDRSLNKTRLGISWLGLKIGKHVSRRSTCWGHKPSCLAQ
jgi:hypothetical protein